MGDPRSFDAVDQAATLNVTLPRVAPRGPEPDAEHYMRWLLEKKSKRRDYASTHERRRLYEERLTTLHDVVFAMRTPVEALRRGADQTIAMMSDISDDENSPSYAAIRAPRNLGDAQRALNLITALLQGSNFAFVLSINFDMVGNALGRKVRYPTPSDKTAVPAVKLQKF